MLVILLIPIFFQFGYAAVDDDLIKDLPGINFKINFKQYSGYLQPDATSFLHYWLVESQNDPTNDPLLLWLNGGPGCSSMDGLFTENGPFRITNVNMTVEENIYAWNKIANVLYIESPTSVGFSYTTDSNTKYGDNETALLNYNALKDFFSKYSEYANRDFFISGESYAGIYLPTLAMYLIKDKDISKNFKGMAIGNGALSDDYLTNSLPPLLYEHALVGESMWENMTADCCKDNGISCDYADIMSTGGKGNDCFRQVVTISFIPQISSLDPYNLYDTCYVDTSLQNRKRTVYYKMFLKRMGLNFEKAEEIIKQAPDYMKRQKLNSNQKPDCYYDGITLYLQREDVRKAIHIPDNVGPWEECVDFTYDQEYADMAYQLKTAIDANVRILIYNGDCDTVCNAMGDKQFIDSLGREQLNSTYPWLYKQDYQNENAGWQTLYDGIHFLSVRGSGHFVPMDKPREALQMITNFIRNKDYSTSTGIDVTPQPMLPPANNDTIIALPGVNFPINFKQYSGYLQPDSTSFLHYWLVESQNDPANDPLLLWLNGGPGCSSMDGLFTENGPFRITNVNMTVEENVYSWNKIANVLYIESPTSVGFSYTTDPNTAYGDDETALLNYNALKDFFAKYPEYNSRDFYISGESYAGIYLPTLAMYLIKDTNIAKNFKGMAIGNGYLSVPYLTNSIPPLFYEHVLVGEKIWNNVTQDCCNGNAQTCNYNAILDPKNKNTSCYLQVATISSLANIAGLDPYNIYDTCYVDTTQQRRKRTVYYKTYLQRLGLDFEKVAELRRRAPADFKIQRLDSDSIQLKPDCYYDGITLYLQRQDVRKAIHIPDNVPAWEECVDFDYHQQYDDMADQLKTVIDAKVRIMIYNGDVDTVCNAMGDKQFIESLGRSQLNPTFPWYYEEDYENQNAGWQTLYDGIHFVSVRGSGHFVPFDKPREALQMITNFIRNRDYSSATGIDVTRQEVKPQIILPPPTKSRSQSMQSCFWLSILLCIIGSIAHHLF